MNINVFDTLWSKSMLLLYLIISDCNGLLLFNFAENTTVDYRTANLTLPINPNLKPVIDTSDPDIETLDMYLLLNFVDRKISVTLA